MNYFGGINASPLYVRVKEILIEMIQRGDFPSNRLPPESDLSELLGVSRTTIRETLATLNREGIITKRHGIGNLIHRSTLDSKMRIDRYTDFVALLEDGGHTVRVDRVAYTWLRDGQTLFIELCYFADEVPAIKAEVFVDGKNLQGDPLADESLYGTLPDFLNKYATEPVSHSLCYFRPAVVNGDSSELLDLPEGAPILEWNESFFSIFDRELAQTKIHFNPSVVSFSLLRKWE